MADVQAFSLRNCNAAAAAPLYIKFFTTGC